MRIAKWLVPLILGAIAVVPASRVPARLRAMKPQRTVPTLRVEPDEFIVGITSEHLLEGCEDTPVRVGEGGGGYGGGGGFSKIAYICEDGANVNAGDVIARLETRDLERTLGDARLAYANAQNKIAQQERDRNTEIENSRHAVEQAKRELEILQKSNATELDTAQKELEHKRLLEESARLERDRKQRLANPEIGLASRQDFEQAERSLRSATFAVTAAEKALELMQKRHASQVEQKQSETANAEYKLKSAEEAVKPASEAARYSIQSMKERLERAQRDLDQAVIKAPVAGTVVLAAPRDYQTTVVRPFQVGDNVYAGVRVATISNVSRLEVNLSIEETAIAPVKVGQEVMLSVDAVPGKTYRGAVATIASSARPSDPWDNPDLKANARYFMVRVTVNRPDAKLRPALKCKGRIVFKRLKNVLAVPLSAVVHPRKNDCVFVLRGPRFSLQTVKTGDRNDEAVVITAGLRPGEVVALEDPTAAVEE